MLQPPIRAPMRLLNASASCTCLLESAFSRMRLSPFRTQLPSVTPPSKITVRNATHKSEGRANRAKQGAGKRLGAKKTGDQYVIPGNILYRQRGTLWFPGENVGIGRDHTLYATQAGYVKFYRDPQRHKDRKYIGVTLERDHVLPVLKGVPRKRRLGLFAQRMGESASLPLTEGAEEVAEGVREELEGLEVKPPTALPRSRPGYAVREANWQIGKMGDANAAKIEPFQPGDRFKAWKKRGVRKQRAVEKRGMKAAQKAGKKKGKK